MLLFIFDGLRVGRHYFCFSGKVTQFVFPNCVCLLAVDEIRKLEESEVLFSSPCIKS